MHFLKNAPYFKIHVSHGLDYVPQHTLRPWPLPVTVNWRGDRVSQT